MTLHGRVENGVVVFQSDPPLPEGTLVAVTPLQPQSAGRGPIAVSKEQREALLGLIGMWKVEHPPNDEEVDRIIDEARMKKYG
jgi:hypothetical protein